jgi:hypothetical protein
MLGIERVDAGRQKVTRCVEEMDGIVGVRPGRRCGRRLADGAPH